MIELILNVDNSLFGESMPLLSVKQLDSIPPQHKWRLADNARRASFARAPSLTITRSEAQQANDTLSVNAF
jgi:hypothetical protein